jgi:hypothetical protein
MNGWRVGGQLTPGSCRRVAGSETEWKGRAAFVTVPLPMIAPPASVALRLFRLTALASLLTVGPAGATDPPIPAPGQTVPPHAAGGWPTNLTGDDQKPKRTPEQEAHLNSVAQELKRLANEHGPDSVVLQSKFMVKSMSSGAVGPTEVRVAGPSAVAGNDHLEIAIETGIYFDETTTTEESRREKIWSDVALPVLDEMMSFKIEPAGLDLLFFFDVQPLSGERGFDPTEAHRHEGFRVTLGAPLLNDLATDQVAGDAVRTKVDLKPSHAVAATRDAVVPSPSGHAP